MRVQKTRYEPVHIALEELDQPVIRIEPAPFLAAEQLGRRKFLSSLYGEIFLQENDFGFGRGHSRWPKKLFCPKSFPDTMDPQCSAVSANQAIKRAIKDFRSPRPANSLIA